MLSIDLPVWQLLQGCDAKCNCPEPALCQMRRKNIGVPEVKKV